MGKGCSGDKGAVVDANTVMDLILLPNTTKDRDGLGDGRLVDEHLREPTLECRVLLNVLAVFGEGRCANTAEFATGEEGFEEVGSIHAVALARHDEMELVDEQDYARAVLRSLVHFVEDGLDAFFVLSLVLGARHERTHVEGVKAAE